MARPPSTRARIVKRVARQPKPALRGRRLRWVHWEDERLLDLRMCDLGLRLEETPLWEAVAALHVQLRERGLARFKPHAWLSSEWFSPDGVPGVALPFYLAHPRLRRLERSMLHQVEGGSAEALARLLRHEAGHALDNAYRLHTRPRWREVFGLFSTPYAAHYRPEPYSRSFVQHLPHWYAQSHPAEDFAETFAVWLGPPAVWQRRYRGWPALAKLEYMDELARRIARATPEVALRERTEALEEQTQTLREHYRLKKERYRSRFPYAFDRGLKRLFSHALPGDRRRSAASFLRALRPQLVSSLSRWSDSPAYTVEQVLHDMTARARELNLVVDSRAGAAKLDAALLVAVHTMRFLHTGYHRLAR